MPRTIAVNLTALQHSLLTVFQHLASQRPSLYRLSSKRPTVFMVTAPNLVAQVSNRAGGAIAKGPLPNIVRTVMLFDNSRDPTGRFIDETIEVAALSSRISSFLDVLLSVRLLQ